MNAKKLLLATAAGAVMALTVTAGVGAAELPCVATSDPVDVWLIGDWRTPTTPQRLEFRRDGDGVAWTYRRARMQSQNPMWGEKTAVTGGGKVVPVATCEVEGHGMYLTSENPGQLGNPLRFKLSRMADGTLVGEMIGSAGTPIRLRFQKEA
jgi:hypothetical protein